jgi:thermitase
MYSAKSARGASGNDYYSHNSEGTSYATAITAGACAIWQAHHGRQNLINTYGAPFMLHLFRWAVKNSCDQTTPQMTAAGTSWDSARRGYGILNAEQLLNLSLPADTQALITAMRAENMISAVRECELRAIATSVCKECPQ